LLLRRNITPGKAQGLARFFKTGPGEYGYGDRFLGVMVPQIREVARECAGMPARELARLLHSRYHEERLLALLIMVLQYSRAGDTQRQRIYRCYRANLRWINNWDLVDLTAPQIVGGLPGLRVSTLLRMAVSRNMWERRVAIVATLAHIRRGVFSPTLRVARVLLQDSEDLIHKATGWMLREVAKRDRAIADGFLRRHQRLMPRTMLRYAIERHPPRLRRRYMKR
jgi:3-methyladenine DNA glycosylase AlkD